MASSDLKRRSLRTAIIFAAGLLVLLIGALWMMPADRGGGGVARVVLGGPFAMVDQDNKPVTEADIKGKPTLMFFGFTHCPDVCPTALYEVSQVLRALGPDADRVNVYFVSVDPERDTPAVMKDYLGSFDPHLRALSGSPEATAQMMKAYRVYARKVPLQDGDYTMDHTAMVYLLDKDGRFVAPFNVKRIASEAAEDLRRYL